MTISVYSSIMPGDPDEVYEDSGLTVEQWVKSKTANYRRGECQPISCMVNGAIIPPKRWGDVVIDGNDNVEFRPVPHGDALNFLAVIFPTVFGPIAGPQIALDALLPDITGQQGQGNQGARLEPADARANTARLGQAVPESFGEYIKYPDYLNQPRTYYQDTTTQVLNLMLCVGVGSYDAASSKVKIAETPFNEISGATYQLFPPGADVSVVENHENWFLSKEVGSTSSSAGIRLKGVTFDERTYFGSATGSGSNLSGVTVGELWTQGLDGTIKLTQTVTVVDGGGGGANPDLFQGEFQHLKAGLTVNVESDLGVNGTYVVRTINIDSTEITLETTGGSPLTDIAPGTGSMAIDKSGTKYTLDDIFGSMLEVRRILTSGANDPDWVQLPSAGLTVEIVWEAGTFTAQRSGPFTACPENETTDTIEIDVFCPAGLGVVDDKSINFRSRTIRIEWREVGDLFYTAQNETVSGATRDQLGFTFTVNLPSAIRPEVRISRIGEEDVSVTSLDTIEFTALRCKLPTVTSYPDITTMAVTIVGSDDLSSQSNNRINLETVRRLPEVSGGVLGPEVATRKISSAAIRVAKSLGYDDSQLDLDEFERLEAIWTPRGDTFDYVFGDTTAKDAIDTILRAGFAEFTIDTGIIKPVRDQVRTQLEDGYSPENMTAPLQRKFKARQAEEPDGVEVEYTAAGTWTTETVQALLPGDQGKKLDKIKLDGVTDRTRAWRIAMRRRRGQKYRRWTYSFDTELDALNSEYLSYVPLLDDIPGYGGVSILRSISSDRIVVSEPLDFVAGKTHVVAYRDENGDTKGPYTATPGPDEHTALVAIPKPWPAINPSDREPTHIYFGTTDRWHFPALITGINPSSPLEVSVTATNYDSRVYADDDNSPE